jgi:hypothetical protein
VDIVEFALHQNQVQPLPPLITDSRHAGHFVKAKSSMKLDGSGIAPVNSGDHDSLVVVSGVSTERGDEGPTNPAAPMVAGNVDRMLNNKSVARPTGRIAEVTVGRDSDDEVAIGGNQHRMVSELLLTEPTLSFLNAVLGLSPLVGCGIEEGIVDLGDGGYIVWGRWSDRNHVVWPF